MSKDDFHVILYKILSYFYECLKEGIEPSIWQARELVKVNEAYWSNVVIMAYQGGYIEGIYIPHHRDARDQKWYASPDLKITERGIAYLQENSLMHEAGKLLGRAFWCTLENAIALTKLL